MTETLTESFCERCGTRYEFSAPTRLNPLRKTRGLIGGLKNYLTSTDALGDAINDAMRGEEGTLATAQLEAFHEAFNFCIDCRQYTCLSCWNEDAGRCRSCVPIPGTDDLAERLAAAGSAQAVAGIAEATMTDADIQQQLGQEAWPTSDLPLEPAASADDAWATTPGAWAGTPTLPAEGLPERAPVAGGFVGADGFVYETQEQADKVAATMRAEAEAAAAQAAEEALAALAAEEQALAAQAEADAAPADLPQPAAASLDPAFGPMAEAEPEPEAEPVAAEAEPEPEAEPVAAEVEREAEPVAATVEPPRLRVVAWDEDAAYELEPEPIVAEAEPELEPVAAEIEREAEPVAAELEPEPEPVAAEAEPEPVGASVEPAIGETAPMWPDAAPEPVVADAESEPVAAEVEVEPEPEPVAAEVEPEPEPQPIAAAEAAEPDAPTPIGPHIAPISETILRFPQRPSRPDAQPLAAEDDSPEAAARRAQLDLLGLGDVGEGPMRPDRPAVLPYRSRGAAVSQEEMALRAAADARFWEASAREVAGAVGHVGVQNCGQCGLSLSATARFCRRCGTRQAQPA